MEANTYPDPRVSRFINEYTVPVQFNVKEDVGAPNRFHAHWTPAIMFRDVDDNEFRRSFGSLNPDQFLGEFALARALRYFHTEQFEKASEAFEQALEFTASDPFRHPENLYWVGSAKYEVSDNVDDLMGPWKELQQLYPDNDWAKRSRQLKLD